MTDPDTKVRPSSVSKSRRSTGLNGSELTVLNRLRERRRLRDAAHDIVVSEELKSLTFTKLHLVSGLSKKKISSHYPKIDLIVYDLLRESFLDAISCLYSLQKMYSSRKALTEMVGWLLDRNLGLGGHCSSHKFIIRDKKFVDEIKKLEGNFIELLTQLIIGGSVRGVGKNYSKARNLSESLFLFVRRVDLYERSLRGGINFAKLKRIVLREFSQGRLPDDIQLGGLDIFPLA